MSDYTNDLTHIDEPLYEDIEERHIPFKRYSSEEPPHYHFMITVSATNLHANHASLTEGRLLSVLSYSTWALKLCDVDDIWNRIDRERDRQKELWGDDHDDAHSVRMWARLILRYVGRADEAYDDSLDAYTREMVKVAALAVAALNSWQRQEETT